MDRRNEDYIGLLKKLKSLSGAKNKEFKTIDDY